MDLDAGSPATPMLAALLPAPVVCVEVLGEFPTPALLLEEEVMLGNVSDGRRRDFATVRACARRAMAELGMPPVAILPGPNREPLWPPGIVGSLTHCTGFRAAAVARLPDVPTLGIDAEVHRALPPGVLDKVVVADERRWLRVLAGSGTYWDCVVFSAKESVYKAWYPLTRSWLGFEDVIVTVDPFESTFHARLLVARPDGLGGEIVGFNGRWLVQNGLVLTAVTSLMLASTDAES
jgi:4'-phosphopantetheinyl transferase EntD